MSGKVIGAKFSDADAEHIAVLADELSQRTGRLVSLGEVIRTFVLPCLAADPVDDVRRARFNQRKAAGLVGQVPTPLSLDPSGKLQALRADLSVKHGAFWGIPSDGAMRLTLLDAVRRRRRAA
jgi:hypothetical protein